MSRSRSGQLIKMMLIWLMPGMLTGLLLSAVLTSREYEAAAVMTGAVLRERSVSAGLKNQKAEDRKEGEAYLSEYGYHRFQKMKDNIAAVSGISVVCFEGAGLLLFFCRRKEKREQARRIRELTEYLQSVNKGEAGLLVRKEDQFSRLEDEIYKTMMELTCTKEEAVKDHQILSDRIADIAHQLKTPLTSMSLMTELLEEYQPEEAKEYLKRLKNQVERLKNLASGLLLLAKLDSHTIVFKKEKVGICTLIKESAEPLCDLMEQKRIKLEMAGTVDETSVIETDRQWTGEAVLNILKNCIEHTPIEGHITVSFENNPIYAEITITDSGTGFRKKDLPHLFERFYRGEGAAKDSAGIGLALAKTIIERQNGQILAENTSAGNARFRIKFR